MKMTDQQKLARKIKSIFCGVGFEYFKTNGLELNIGLRKCEIDSLFIYENIWLVCEDTTTSNKTDHARTKNEAMKEIKSNLCQFVKLITKNFKDREEIINRYDITRIKIFGLYVPSSAYDSKDVDFSIFENLVLVQPHVLDYLKWLVDCIKLSALPEVFRFLRINTNDVGIVTTSKKIDQIQTTIICPNSATGSKYGVRVVSFMMSAEELMQICCVLRKDDWDSNDEGYQRLIDKKKIKDIRKYVLDNGEAFYNNIIFALPNTVSFNGEDGSIVGIEDINDFENKYTLNIPKIANSVFVIDGQHRIYAHYKTLSDDAKMKKLRSELHLLVSGLIFPSNMRDRERRRIQAQIFLDINKNAKPVDSNLLLHIKAMSAPLADSSLAKRVVELMNSCAPFKGLFNLSCLNGPGIRTTTIIKYALSRLVSVNNENDSSTLFYHWLNDSQTTYEKSDINEQNEAAIEEYQKYCCKCLSIYFSAIKDIYRSEWNNKSKLLSVTSVNGFIIAYGKTIEKHGVRDFKFYKNSLNKHKFSFENKEFRYTSSHYAEFGGDVFANCFK